MVLTYFLFFLRFTVFQSYFSYLLYNTSWRSNKKMDVLFAPLSFIHIKVLLVLNMNAKFLAASVAIFVIVGIYFAVNVEDASEKAAREKCAKQKAEKEKKEKAEKEQAAKEQAAKEAAKEKAELSHGALLVEPGMNSFSKAVKEAKEKKNETFIFKKWRAR